MKLFYYLAIGLSAFYLSTAHAGTAKNKSFSRMGVQSYTYSSDVLSRDYVIDIVLPPGFNPADSTTKYPVIYILVKIY